MQQQQQVGHIQVKLTYRIPYRSRAKQTRRISRTASKNLANLKRNATEAVDKASSESVGVELPRELLHIVEECAFE